MVQFKPTRIRKHKQRQKDQTRGSNTNVEILPVHAAEKAKKKEALREELRPERPMSSKKKKRLDKYIDTKLRKEENLELLKKLAANKVDTSLYRSTKDLGASKDSKRKSLSRALDRERAGIHTADDIALLYERHDPLTNEYDSEDSSAHSDIQESESKTPPTPAASHAHPAHSNNIVVSNQPAESIIAGQGLKRPLQTDAEGNPIIKKRQRTNKRTSVPVPVHVDEIPWEGFSSDSSSDTGPERESQSEVGSESKRQTGSRTASETGSQADDDSDEGTSQSELESDSDELSEISASDFNAILSTIAQARLERDQKEEQVRSQRRTDFKEWANQQINEARDFTPIAPISHIEALAQSSQPKSITPRAPENDPLPKELEVPSSDVQRKVFSVQVERPEHIQESRLKLPVVADEQKIMEAIHNNHVVVVCGATGSGKTTQVPQFLYEAGYGSREGPTPGMIGVTQPRRVAAVTMAKRVGEELGAASSKVGYQIRFDSTLSKDTAIKFMTDGILIRELGQDFALTKYSVIIIDEAHERNVNTDILIGMLSRIVDLRAKLSKENSDMKPLKMIIMSATLMVDAFIKNSQLFRNGEPPLVQSEGRQYPVTMHFARRTQRDYIEEAYKKITKGHRKLPPGGMLVFLTGQVEINALAKRLKSTLSNVVSSQSGPKVHISATDAPLETEDLEVGDDQLRDDYISEDDIETDSEGDDREFEIEEDKAPGSANVSILPLYSQLPTKEQLKVFEAPPENTRMIILATNVAETSITIPGIRYVIDCGRVKDKKYNKQTGVQSFEIGWISKASAAQRAGRAGRTGPGHCYRLYSSAVFERDFEEHTTPEILKAPSEGVVLQLKSMGLHHVVNFPFPTPPERQEIARAENLLSYLGALDKEKNITRFGRDLTVYPLSPRFAKMLLLGNQHKCMQIVVALVSALAVSEVFIHEDQLDIRRKVLNEGDIYTDKDHIVDDARDRLRKEYNKIHQKLGAHDSHADAIKTLTALCAYIGWQSMKDAPSPDKICENLFLRPKAMAEAQQLYEQLLHIVALNRPGLVEPTKIVIPSPSTTQIAATKQILAAGFIDQIAIRADFAPSPPEIPRKPKRAIDVPYLTLFPSHTSGGLSPPLEELAVFIHPSSILSRLSPSEMPLYLVYSHLQQATASHIESAKIPKTRMHPLTSVTAMQLSALARGSQLLEYGKPIGNYELVPGDLTKRMAWVVPSLVGRGQGIRREWPLPAVKVLQKKNSRGQWTVERVLEELPAKKKGK